eukprot:363891-Chlamydomonas_euryale.AAC.9
MFIPWDLFLGCCSSTFLHCCDAGWLDCRGVVLCRRVSWAGGEEEADKLLSRVRVREQAEFGYACANTACSGGQPYPNCVCSSLFDPKPRCEMAAAAPASGSARHAQGTVCMPVACMRLPESNLVTYSRYSSAA